MSEDAPVELFFRDPDAQLHCKWGDIEWPDPNPGKNQVGHLLLITKEQTERLLEGPFPHNGAVAAARYDADGKRIFIDMQRGGKKWVWQLHPAVFADGLGPDDIYIGRWV